MYTCVYIYIYICMKHVFLTLCIPSLPKIRRHGVFQAFSVPASEVDVRRA